MSVFKLRLATVLFYYLTNRLSWDDRYLLGRVPGCITVVAWTSPPFLLVNLKTPGGFAAIM